MQGNRLYKREKLCSRTAINMLFAGGRSVVAYPLRAVVAVKRCGDDTGSEPGQDIVAKFMITVPKKKIRTAVGRVLVRRRIREAYRLNRSVLAQALQPAGCVAEIAFLYMDTSIADYATIEASMKKLLGKISSQVADKEGGTH